MPRTQAWERFDSSFDDLDQPLGAEVVYITKTWEGGTETAVLVANEENDQVTPLDPNDWIGRAATSRIVTY